MSTSSDDMAVLDRLAEDFVGKLRHGERPPIRPYVDQNPHLATEIQRLFPTLVTMEQLNSTLAARPEARQSDLPARIGEYRILRKLGEGGMGVVYEAIQESLGRHVALKMLPTHARLSVRFRERFRREARAAARLHHPHIVPVFGVGEEAGSLFYAMQYIPGRGLDALVPSRKAASAGQETVSMTLRPMANGPAKSPESSPVNSSPGSDPTHYRWVAEMGIQVAEALAYAHEEGVIHRDIKPSNLLLDDHGSIWVTDFGLAKTNEGEGLTEPGDIVGTIRYMAPERFNGWSDARSDIYGLGATLYEVLTGRPMFDQSDRAGLICAIMETAAPRPRKWDRHIPADLETIVQKSTAREPKDRYASAHELAKDLRNYLEGRPILARRHSMGAHAWRWCRRKPLAAGLAAGIFGLLITLLVGSIVVNFRLDDQNSQIVSQNVQIGDAQAALQDQLRETESARKREAGANVQARQQLMLALRREAQAARWSRRPGSRGETFEAVRKLTELAREFPLTDEETREVRNLVIAASAQMDVVPETTTDFEVIIGSPFSPDLKHFLRIAAHGPVLCEYPSGREVASRRLTGVGTFAFSPDGKHIVIASEGRNWRGRLAYRVWNWQTNEIVAEIPAENGQAVFAINREGTEVALAYIDGTMAIHSLPDGRKLRTLSVEGGVREMRYSPIGNSIALHRHARTLEIWNLDDGKKSRTMMAPIGTRMMCMAWSADGQMVAVGCSDFRAHVWHLENGQLAADLIGHQAEVTTCAFDPHGQWLATVSWDGTTRFWNPITGLLLSTVRGELLAVHPDGARIGFRAAAQLGIWTVSKSEAFKSLHGHVGIKGPWHASFGADGKVLATSSPDAIRLWDAETGRAIGELRPPGGALTAIFSPNGKYLLSAGHNHCARWPTRFDPSTNTLHIGRSETLLANQEGMTERRASISADGERAVVHNQRREVAYVFNVAEPALWRSVGPLRELSGVTMSPDGRWAIGTTWPSGHARVWDALTHRVAHDFPISRTVTVAFSPDGERVVLGSDQKGELWKVGEWTHIGDVPSESNASGMQHPAFSPDGRMLVGSRGTNRDLYMLDSQTLKTIARLEPPDPQISGGSCFSADGSKLAIVCGTRVVQVWDLRAIRKKLATYGLDWDQPPFADERPTAGPVKIEIEGDGK